MYDSKEQVMGIVRHILTAGGGYFAASGVVAQDEVTTIVSGLIALVGVIWSVVAKKV